MNKQKNMRCARCKKKSVYKLCKACAIEEFKTLRSLGFNLKQSLWIVCAENELPYVENGLGMTNMYTTYEFKGNEPFIPFSSLCNNVFEGFATEAPVETAAPAAPPAEVEGEYQHFVNTWGDNYTIEQYKKLEGIFNQYMGSVDEISPALVYRYRDLAKAELRLAELGVDADPKDVKTAMDVLQSLYKMLNLGDFASSVKDDTERFIDKRIWLIENTTPAECEDLLKYKDYAGRQEEYEENMRNLRNSLAGTKEYPKLKRE